MSTTPFLTGRWESLILLNHVCPRELLEPLVPLGTELDPWDGRYLVSLVGFLFTGTRLRGLPIPGHRRFEEVNLRFYVRCTVDDGSVRRGVVFVREFVPRRAVAAVARWIYNEPYRAVPMDHRIALDPDRGGEVEYSWTTGGGRQRLSASVQGQATSPAPGSEAEFITEHYWGYTRQRDGGTLEYRVDHPRWPVWQTARARYEAPPGAEAYGPEFAEVLEGEPASAFVAVGSEISVFPGRRIERYPEGGDP